MVEFLSRRRVIETYDIDEANILSGKFWERLEAIPVEKSYGLRWNLAALDRSALAYGENDGY